MGYTKTSEDVMYDSQYDKDDLKKLIQNERRNKL